MNSKKIIMRMPNWLGDTVMATAALDDIYKSFPQASITLMCPSGFASLFSSDPRVSEIFAFSKEEKKLREKVFSKDRLKVLETGRYDVGILFTNSFSSAWEFFHAKMGARIGFAKELRSILLTQAIPFPKDLEKRHLCDVYKELIKPLGAQITESGPSLFLKEEEILNARNQLSSLGVKSHEIIIGMNPAAAYGMAKCWPQERFRDVIASLVKNFETVKIVLFGDQHSIEMGLKLSEGFQDKVINLCGKTSVRQLCLLIKNCHIFLTNDSGPMHLADALGVKVVALFGSTNPVKTGPYYSKDVIKKNVPCSPCYKRTCPIDFKCMKLISSEYVFEKIHQLLKKENYV